MNLKELLDQKLDGINSRLDALEEVANEPVSISLEDIVVEEPSVEEFEEAVVESVEEPVVE